MGCNNCREERSVREYAPRNRHGRGDRFTLLHHTNVLNVQSSVETSIEVTLPNPRIATLAVVVPLGMEISDVVLDSEKNDVCPHATARAVADWGNDVHATANDLRGQVVDDPREALAVADQVSREPIAVDEMFEALPAVDDVSPPLMAVDEMLEALPVVTISDVVMPSALINGPMQHGDMQPCFEDGLLYRIVQPNAWYFYNDSQEYAMVVSFHFDPDSDISSMPNAVMHQREDRWFVVTTIVYPGETTGFVEGTFRHCMSCIAARAMPAEYRRRVNAEANIAVQRELDILQEICRGSTDPEKLSLACVEQGISRADVSFPRVLSTMSNIPEEGVAAQSAASNPPVVHFPLEVHRDISATVGSCALSTRWRSFRHRLKTSAGIRNRPLWRSESSTTTCSTSVAGGTL